MVIEKDFSFSLNVESSFNDKLIFKLTQDTGINDIENESEQAGSGFSLSGQKVNNGYRGIIIKNGRKILNK